MGLSKSQRIAILLGIDGAFFLLELTVGYAVHSLALVADAFHMLNDVLSLCVGWWAVRVANKRSSESFTYGWQRAETLGALVNGVFLLALCMSIFLEAIQRFVEPQVVSNPFLVLIVGCFGLASNILGLFLFHDHSHGAEGEAHPHAHGNAVRHAEEGHAPGHADEPEHAAEATERTGLLATKKPNTLGRDFSRADEEDTTLSAKSSSSTQRRSTSNVGASSPGHRRRTSAFGSVNDIPVHPASFRQGLLRAAQVDEISEPDSEEAVLTRDEPFDPGQDGAREGGYGGVDPPRRAEHSHRDHHHAKPGPPPADGGGHGHGHAHGDLNMRGVFLHVMGDALGNVGVIATALIIWLTDWSFRYYFDPAISLLITAIILASAVPLCKAASRILLQAVPVGLSIDEIRQDIEQLDGVVEAHHLHVWQLSDTKLVASLHVKVDCEVQGSGSASYMRLARAIQSCLHAYGIHSSTIQPEFLQGSIEYQNAGPGTRSPGQDSLAPTGKAPGHPPASGRAAASRTSSLRSMADACMLDCGDDCKPAAQCCSPDLPQKSDDGAGHAPGKGQK